MTSFFRDNSTQTGGVSSAIYATADGGGHRYFYGNFYNDDGSWVSFDHINTITYYMGLGNDYLSIDGSAMSEPGNALYVNGGGGTDTLNANFSVMTSDFTLVDGSLTTANISAVNFEKYTLTLGSGNDSVTLTGAADVNIALGAGNDTVSVTNAVGYQSFNGNGGTNGLTVNNGGQAVGVASAIYSAGASYFYGNWYNDTSRTDYDNMHNLNYTMGSGDDTINLDGTALTAVGNTVTVDAATGYDRLNADLRVVTTNITMTDHSLTTSRVSLTGFDVYSISFGSGNDTVTLNHANGDALSMYGGDDVVSITDATGYQSVDGGAGFNQLTVDNSGQVVGVSSAIYSSGGYFYGNWYNDTSRTDYDHMFKLTYKMGSGNDHISLDGSALAAVANTVSVDVAAGYDTLSADLRVITTNIVMADGTLTTARVSLTGFDQYDLYFGSGNDSATRTGAANDALRMGAGNDTVTITAATGYQSVDGGDGFDVLSVDVSSGSATGANIYSSGGYFYGNLYNDINRTDFDHTESVTFKAGSGNNAFTVDGSALVTGNNALNVDAGGGQDILSANLSLLTTGVTVTDTSITSTRLSLANFETLHMTFGSGNDSVTLTGAADDSLTMAAGNDTVKIIAAVGYESVNGGAGRDTLIVDNTTLLVGVTSNIYTSGGYFYGNLYNDSNRTDFDQFETLNYATGIGNDTVNVDATAIVNGGKLQLNGGAGTDTLNLNLSGAGSQTLTFLTGGVLLVGASRFTGFELLNLSLSSAGNTVLMTAGNDSFTGGNGNDTIDGGAGNDLLNGSNGFDVASYASAGGAVTVSLALQGAGQNTIGAGTDTLSNFEGLLGSAFNDSLTGDGNANTLDGGAGNDTLAGGLGNDSYYIDALTDVIVEAAGAGTDTVYTAFAYTLGANLEGLILTGSAAVNGTGNALDNSLTGNDGANVLAGGAGNDTYYVGVGDTVTELSGQGTDVVFSSVSFDIGTQYIEAVNLTGTGNTTATGSSSSRAETLTGNDGNNVLDGKSGADTMAGGLGDDTYTVDNAGEIVLEGAGAGNDLIQAYVSHVMGANVETLVLLGAGNINGTGNAIANVITGNAGNNRLSGLDGNDRLDGGAGTDTMTGGLGDDTFVVDNAGDSVVEATGEGTDTVLASVSYVLGAASFIENLTLTGTGNINATGNGLANSLTGTAGTNVLDGGAGADTLSGGAGNDTYIVDDAGDTIVETSTGGKDAVNASVSYTIGASAYIEILNLTGVANITGIGNSIANIINGNDGNNALDGKGGADTMTGGLGDDTYYIDNAGDRAYEVAGGGNDTVRSSVSYNGAGQNIETIILTSTGNIDATGQGLDNQIYGNTANNTLNGGAGNDMLNGGKGNDILIGGVGADTFVFSTFSGLDTISDFKASQNDIININAYSHGVVNGGGVVISQSGADTLIDLGGGNVITVLSTLSTDPAFLSHITW